MRLNGCPKIQDKDKHRNAVWGAQIRNIKNEIIFIARVNIAGNSEKVQIVVPNYEKIIYEEEINLHNGTTKRNIDGNTGKPNVQVSIANISNQYMNSESNYFLDFKLPRNQFIVDEREFDFDNETFKLYYFTSISYDSKLNIININKERPLCGKIINPTD